MAENHSKQNDELVFSFDQLADPKDNLTKLATKIDLSQNLAERTDDLIQNATEVLVEGYLVYDKPYLISDLRIKTTVTVPSTRSLSPVSLTLDFKVKEAYTKEKPTEEDFDEMGTIIELTDDQIDLRVAVEDNIILHVPSRVLTAEEKEKDIMPTGNGWQVISQDQYANAQDSVPNPELAKLKDLFKDKDD